MVARTTSGWLLATPAKRTTAYTNAQLDNTNGRSRSAFLHRPPLRLSLSARFSHSASELQGTSGFGFWNDPFGMSGSWPPVLPQALWFFFASPPSSMPLALDVPGYGWKAATIDANRPLVWAMLPLLAPVSPLMAPAAAMALRVPGLHRRLWPAAQRTAAIAEKPLEGDLRNWRHYMLEWRRERLRFCVDGVTVLESPHGPAGPLGLVIWMDNQYLVATPQGRFAWGLTASREAQWMEITDLTIESL
jgi:hypothetical protein